MKIKKQLTPSIFVLFMVLYMVLSHSSVLYPDEYNPQGEMHPTLYKSENIKEFVFSHCDTATQEIYPDIIETAKTANIAPSVVFAIAWADTQCGKYLSTPNNYGNVGNNDRGWRVGYFTPLEGWTAIMDTLNNQYLNGINRIGHLSQGGRYNIDTKYSCQNAPMPYKCYATSEFNWNKNVLRALRVIYNDDTIDENWNFRT